MKAPQYIALAVCALSVYVLLALALTGCTSSSPGLAGIYSIATSSQNTTIHIAYFGLCTTFDGVTHCIMPSSSDNSTIANQLSILAQDLDMSIALQRYIVQPVAYILIIGGVCFLASNIFIGLYKRTEHSRSLRAGALQRSLTIYRAASISSAWAAAACLLSAAWASLATVAAMAFRPPNQISGWAFQQGVPQQGLQWSSAVLSVLFAAGISVALHKSRKRDSW